MCSTTGNLCCWDLCGIVGGDMSVHNTVVISFQSDPVGGLPEPAVWWL